jgi:hypothetical protein
MMSRVFNDHPPDATALVCTTFPAAIATTRVLWERGLTVGRDLSVCAMNIEHPARYSCPSITGLDMPDLTQVLARCFEWFSNNTSWSGSRLLMPEQPVFFIGESSGQVRAAEALKVITTGSRQRRVRPIRGPSPRQSRGCDRGSFRSNHR